MDLFFFCRNTSLPSTHARAGAAACSERMYRSASLCLCADLLRTDVVGAGRSRNLRHPAVDRFDRTAAKAVGRNLEQSDLSLFLEPGATEGL